MKWLFLVFLMIGFASGIGVDLDCPDEIYAGEEFECEVDVFDGDGKYDLKIEVDEERNSVLKIWDEEKGWKSGYYYLKEFVRDDGVVRLKVSEVGRYDVVLKLRQDGERVEFDVGRLKVKEGEESDVVGSVYIKEGIVSEGVGVISLGGDPEVISFGGDVVVEEEWDYVSKDGKIVDWLPYGFCLFLICLVGIMMWERGDSYTRD